MSHFFGTPVRALALGVALSSAVALPGPADAVGKTEKEPNALGDYKDGGEELFQQIIPSCIQVFNGGGGSGYIIDKGGYAITNRHVTGVESNFEITLYGGDETHTRFKGTMVGVDPALDFALIQVHAPDDLLAPIKLADTDKMVVGDLVATCGSPGGSAGNTNIYEGREGWLDYFNFNMGLLTEILPMDRTTLLMGGFYDHEKFADLYQLDYGTAVQYLFHVDAAINHGNSGGPAVNARGEAIGTNTWKFHDPFENMGFSVPVNLLARSAREILQYGRVRRPWLGIALHDSHPASAEVKMAEKGLADMPIYAIDAEPEQMKVYNINNYAPAAKYLKEGDIILAVDGKRYENIFDVYKLILNKQVGDKVTLHVKRNGIGLPPITIELAEKRNRYTNTYIYAEGGPGYVGSSGAGTAGAGVVGITY